MNRKNIQSVRDYLKTMKPANFDMRDFFRKKGHYVPMPDDNSERILFLTDNNKSVCVGGLAICLCYAGNTNCFSGAELVEQIFNINSDLVEEIIYPSSSNLSIQATINMLDNLLDTGKVNWNASIRPQSKTGKMQVRSDASVDIVGQEISLRESYSNPKGFVVTTMSKAYDLPVDEAIKWANAILENVEKVSPKLGDRVSNGTMDIFKVESIVENKAVVRSENTGELTFVDTDTLSVI